MITVNGEVITPTIFPDGTSQIWKLREVPGAANIVWRFEAERELIDLLSVCALIRGHKSLYMPYLPYARQDKDIRNDQTFSLSIFLRVLQSAGLTSIMAYDIHNYRKADLLTETPLLNIYPDAFHSHVLNKFKPDWVCFPDSGAADRYFLDEIPSFCAIKERDPLTGKITKQKIDFDGAAVGVCGTDRVLIVDDICDGGATFRGLARQFAEKDPLITVGLAVSHGLFTLGKQVLKDAGISEIFTTDSLLKNKGEFPV